MSKLNNFHVIYVSGLGGPEMRREVRTQASLWLNALMLMVFTWWVRESHLELSCLTHNRCLNLLCLFQVNLLLGYRSSLSKICSFIFAEGFPHFISNSICDKALSCLDLNFQLPHIGWSRHTSTNPVFLPILLPLLSLASLLNVSFHGEWK